MGKRVAKLVSALLFVFLIAGCTTVDSKPAPPSALLISDTKEFFDGVFHFERQGKAEEIMENIERSQKMISKGGSEKEIETSVYQLYVKTDQDHDHVITELEAKTFWQTYQRQFDAQLGAGPIKFKQ